MKIIFMTLSIRIRIRAYVSDHTLGMLRVHGYYIDS